MKCLNIKWSIRQWIEYILTIIYYKSINQYNIINSNDLYFFRSQNNIFCYLDRYICN